MTIIEAFLHPEKVRVSGSGDHHGEDLESATAKVVVSGSGNTELRVADALTEHVNASGDWGSILGDQVIAMAILGQLLPLRDYGGQTETGLLAPVPVSVTPNTRRSTAALGSTEPDAPIEESQ